MLLRVDDVETGRAVGLARLQVGLKRIDHVEAGGPVGLARLQLGLERVDYVEAGGPVGLASHELVIELRNPGLQRFEKGKCFAGLVRESASARGTAIFAVASTKASS